MDKIGPVPRKQYEKLLRKLGCSYKKTKGSHVIYSKPGVLRPIVFKAAKEIPISVQQSNRRTLNLSLEEYMSTLAKLK